MTSQFQDEKLAKLMQTSVLTRNNHYWCKIKHTETENTQQHNAINRRD